MKEKFQLKIFSEYQHINIVMVLPILIGGYGDHCAAISQAACTRLIHLKELLVLRRMLRKTFVRV